MTTKKQAATLLILIFGLMGLGNSQTSTIVKAQVPFGFTANGKAMPAGECTIQAMGIGKVLLSISSAKQHAYAFSIPQESPNGSKQAALVFHKYGDRYFLAGVKREGKIGYRLPVGKLEAELQARNVPEQGFTLLASAK